MGRCGGVVWAVSTLPAKPIPYRDRVPARSAPGAGRVVVPPHPLGASRRAAAAGTLCLARGQQPSERGRSVAAGLAPLSHRSAGALEAHPATVRRARLDRALSAARVGGPRRRPLVDALTVGAGLALATAYPVRVAVRAPVRVVRIHAPDTACRCALATPVRLAVCAARGRCGCGCGWQRGQLRQPATDHRGDGPGPCQITRDLRGHYPVIMAGGQAPGGRCHQPRTGTGPDVAQLDDRLSPGPDARVGVVALVATLDRAGRRRRRGAVCLWGGLPLPLRPGGRTGRRWRVRGGAGGGGRF